ncbi:MAG: hypothetical protein KGP28_06280 [Bdellovibrionales bacterium]|nr:hypothetical protein [Bdellovibrionales bacterium]
MKSNDMKRGLFLAPFFFIACSVTAVRPAQEMSDMEVGIKAAAEVSADLLAPELFRLATETALRARREYRLKNFLDAKRLAEAARGHAERAEFEALRNGAKRDSIPADPLAEPSYAPEPVAEPTPISGDSSPKNPEGEAPPPSQPKSP